MKRLLLLCLLGFFMFGCAKRIGLKECYREVIIGGIVMWDCEKRLLCNDPWKPGCPCPSEDQEPCLKEKQ